MKSLLPIFQSGTSEGVSPSEFMLLQTKWAAVINPVIGLPQNQSLILKNIVLTSGSNTINHHLGQELQGWKIVRQNAAASIYDDQDNNSMSNLTLILVSDANVTVSIEVF